MGSLRIRYGGGGGSGGTRGVLNVLWGWGGMDGWMDEYS